MNVAAPLILRSDVVLMPVAELAADVRAKFESEEGDYTITRTQGRMGTQVIDGETATLLQLFREPRTIVEAVIENSRALQKDPEAWLEELIPHIGIFLRNKVLVPADAPEEKEIRQLVDHGTKVGDWEIVRIVSLIEDTEIYRVRRGDVDGALKIMRATSNPEHGWFGNEVTMLRHLDGRVAPRLLDAGTHEERPYLVIEWIEGIESTVAGSLRRHDRVGQLELATAIATAYADLHDAGVIHADVHPRNVLIDASGRAWLIDYGWSRIDDGIAHPHAVRAGMFYFFEPEYIASVREGRSLASTRAGEQYALAALLYQMITTKHYIEFRYGREEMSRMIENEPALAFEARDLAPWPELESILQRALSKDPAQRFGSVREMAEALRGAHAIAVQQSLATPLEPHALALVEQEIAHFSRGGMMFEQGYSAPKSSVNFGAAGAAFGLLRIAEVRSDPKLLALAEVWATRAMSAADTPEGWYEEEGQLKSADLGTVTPYHTQSGLYAVRALLCRARGDAYGQTMWANAFINASLGPCHEMDLTLGRSGTLLFASLLLAAGINEPRLRELGDATMAELWANLDQRGPIAELGGAYVGIAHGWAGYLYATLHWHRTSGSPLPARFMERLEQIKAMRVPKGRGAQWPRLANSDPWDRMSGWCHGTAGYTFFWLLAHDVFGGDEYLRLAELAAWSTWEEPLQTADLCCGSGGRAYALLSLYRRTGEREWLGRARQLANHAATAVETSLRRHALWKGDVGVATLIADLESPETSSMPLFE